MAQKKMLTVFDGLMQLMTYFDDQKEGNITIYTQRTGSWYQVTLICELKCILNVILPYQD